MSWCRHSAITSTCRRASSPIVWQYDFSTSASLKKKFKPQELFLLPGQPKARKSKVPKKVLAWRAQREGLVAEGVNAESDPIAIFAEDVELDNHKRRPTTEDEDSPFGLKPGASRGISTRRTWRDGDDFGRPRDEGASFGIGRRMSLFNRDASAARQSSSFAETRMSQRVRETRESLVDLDKPSTSTPAAPPPVEAHPETVIPAWKIPTPSEYEKYGRKNRGSMLGRERRPDDGRRRESNVGWSDQADPGAGRRGRETPSRNLPSSGIKSDSAPDRQPAPYGHIDAAQQSPPAERTPGRWEPTKKISIPAMQGLRALHQSDPKTFSHAVLSEKFGVSREAVARIIRSKFRDEQP